MNGEHPEDTRFRKLVAENTKTTLMGLNNRLVQKFDSKKSQRMLLSLIKQTQALTAEIKKANKKKKGRSAKRPKLNSLEK